jgi:SnoaL-like domain
MNSRLNPDDLFAEVQRLADIDAITCLKAKGVRLIDTKDWDSWAREVLSEDHVLHGDDGATGGRDAVVASVSGALAEAKTVHRIHTPEITLTGPDTASGIWPMDDYVTGTFNGTPMTIRGHGWYHEDYVRTALGWRISSSRIVRHRVDMTRGEPE